MSNDDAVGMSIDILKGIQVFADNLLKYRQAGQYIFELIRFEYEYFFILIYFFAMNV